MNNGKRPLRQALFQAPMLLFLTAAIALTVNYFRQAPLSLVGDYSVSSRFVDPAGRNITVPLAEASKLHQLQAATFLDARSLSDYQKSHIAGALSLPWQDVARSFMDIAEQLDDEDVIIAYCDGEHCELSHDLALFLYDMGFSDVRVLVNGWGLWLENGLPVTATGRGDE